MDDLTAFVTARLDEDEAAAKAVKDNSAPWDGQWRARGRYLETYSGIVLAVPPGTGVPGGGDFPPGVADHIARHDPARALRETEACRAILTRYQDHLARMEDPGYPQATARDQAREYEDYVLPALAAIWDDHPDYRPEWRP